MKASTTMLTALMLASNTSLAAQEIAPLHDAFVKGTRIRFAAPGDERRRIVGTVADARTDSVVVDTADVFAQQRMFNPAPVVVDRFRRVTLPTKGVDSVEVSMGRSRVVGMLRGAAVGAAVGGTWVALASLNGRVNPTFADFATGFASGAAIGVGFGVPLGYVYRVERWRLVTRPVIGNPPRFR